MFLRRVIILSHIIPGAQCNYYYGTHNNVFRFHYLHRIL